MNICGNGICVCDNYEYGEDKCSDADRDLFEDVIPEQWYYFDHERGIVLSVEPHEAETGTLYYWDSDLTVLVDQW